MDIYPSVHRAENLRATVATAPRRTPIAFGALRLKAHWKLPVSGRPFAALGWLERAAPGAGRICTSTASPWRRGNCKISVDWLRVSLASVQAAMRIKPLAEPAAASVRLPPAGSCLEKPPRASRAGRSIQDDHRTNCCGPSHSGSQEGSGRGGQKILQSERATRNSGLCGPNCEPGPALCSRVIEACAIKFVLRPATCLETSAVGPSCVVAIAQVCSRDGAPSGSAWKEDSGWRQRGPAGNRNLVRVLGADGSQGRPPKQSGVSVRPEVGWL